MPTGPQPEGWTVSGMDLRKPGYNQRGYYWNGALQLKVRGGKLSCRRLRKNDYRYLRKK